MCLQCCCEPSLSGEHLHIPRHGRRSLCWITSARDSAIQAEPEDQLGALVTSHLSLSFDTPPLRHAWLGDNKRVARMEVCDSPCGLSNHLKLVAMLDFQSGYLLLLLGAGDPAQSCFPSPFINGNPGDQV